jgi:hypothetical protein
LTDPTRPIDHRLSMTRQEKKWYTCRHCDYERCVTSAAFTNHVSRNHKEEHQEAQQKREAERCSPDRPFQCPVEGCERTFNSNWEVDQHILKSNVHSAAEKRSAIEEQKKKKKKKTPKNKKRKQTGGAESKAPTNKKRKARTPTKKKQQATETAHMNLAVLGAKSFHPWKLPLSERREAVSELSLLQGVTGATNQRKGVQMTRRFCRVNGISHRPPGTTSCHSTIRLLLAARLASDGHYQIGDVPLDGNCIFSSMALGLMALGFPVQDCQTLRQTLADNIIAEYQRGTTEERKMIVDTLGDLEIEQALPYHDISDEAVRTRMEEDFVSSDDSVAWMVGAVNTLTQDGKWGGEMFAHSCSKFFRVNVLIFARSTESEEEEDVSLERPLERNIRCHLYPAEGPPEWLTLEQGLARHGAVCLYLQDSHYSPIASWYQGFGPTSTQPADRRVERQYPGPTAAAAAAAASSSRAGGHGHFSANFGGMVASDSGIGDIEAAANSASAAAAAARAAARSATADANLAIATPTPAAHRAARSATGNVVAPNPVLRTGYPVLRRGFVGGSLSATGQAAAAQSDAGQAAAAQSDAGQAAAAQSDAGQAAAPGPVFRCGYVQLTVPQERARLLRHLTEVPSETFPQRDTLCLVCRGELGTDPDEKELLVAQACLHALHKSCFLEYLDAKLEQCVFTGRCLTCLACQGRLDIRPPSDLKTLKDVEKKSSSAK